MNASIVRFAVLPIAVLLAGAPVFGAPSPQTSHDPAAHRHGASAGHGASHPGCPFESGSAEASRLPQRVGQDAFAALAEMRSLLLADPATDWSRADLDAFREHLVDMHRVALDASVSTRPVPGGFEARVTGAGRTLEAIRRMVPAHGRAVHGQDGLDVDVSSLQADAGGGEGVTVRVTTADPAAVARIRGLGFFGFLVAGDHHRPHHRAMALGAGHP